MPDPVPGKESFNAGGIDLTRKTDTVSAMQTSQVPNGNTEITQTDLEWAAEARAAIADDNQFSAQAAAQNIQSFQLRMQIAQEIGGVKGNQSVPNAVFQDGDSGIKDPLALFFMMVFYLDKSTPSFSWADVLKTATKNSNQSWSNTNPDVGFMPQAKFVQAPKPIVKVDPNKAVPTVDNTAAEAAAKTAELNKEMAKNADSLKTPLPAKSEAPENVGGVSSVVIWPIQNMPIISNGFNKSVEWPFTNQIPTMAEPLLAINNGGSSIEIDIEFTYAVGVPGIGDHAGTVGKDGQDPSKPQKENYWTVEEIMGVMYLAQSLVYPFQSVPVTGTSGIINVEERAKELKEEKGGAQYPVVFLRHYSLFPFLTPFVVKSVKIEPDENQPLIITEQNALLHTDTHLTYPAIRQILKITLSMASAHYYLPVFGGKDDGGQIQRQTSGKTYLKLGTTLLKGRV